MSERVNMLMIPTQADQEEELPAADSEVEPEPEDQADDSSSGDDAADNHDEGLRLHQEKSEAMKPPVT